MAASIIKIRKEILSILRIMIFEKKKNDSIKFKADYSIFFNLILNKDHDIKDIIWSNYKQHQKYYKQMDVYFCSNTFNVM